MVWIEMLVVVVPAALEMLVVTGEWVLVLDEHGQQAKDNPLNCLPFPRRNLHPIHHLYPIPPSLVFYLLSSSP